MSFVRFTETRARLGDPQVSIWSRGQIGFNQGAVLEHNINDYKFIILYYDQETQRVGFELTNDKDQKGAVKLAFRGSSGASFSAIPFLRINKIDYKQGTKKYTVTLDEDSGLLVIDLNSPL